MKTLTVRSKRLLAFVLTAAILVLLIPVFALQSSPSSAASTRRFGAWWWYKEDSTNATTRAEYLDLLEQMGVNEVYFYGYTYLKGNSSEQAKLHTFVQDAMNHGMRVSVMYDDAGMVTGGASYAQGQWNGLASGFKTYFSTYPNDAVYGIHYDGEDFTKDNTNLQYYVDNVVKKGIAALRGDQALASRNLQLEVDVNPATWTGPGVTCDGVTGFYNCLAYLLGNGNGTVSFMSYRVTAQKVVDRANAAGGINSCIKYNCAYTCGIETADSGEGTSVDIHTKSKADAATLINGIFNILEKDYSTSKFGVALHHARAFSLLSGTVPTTSKYNGGTLPTSPSGGSIPQTESTQPTTTKKPSTGPLVRNVLWDGDVDATITISNYVGPYDNASINKAIQDDIVENGYITGDEYYEIISTASVTGNSGYATMGFYTGDGTELWGESDRIDGGSSIHSSMKPYTQGIYADQMDKDRTYYLAPHMDENTSLCYFSDADGYTDKVTLSHVTIIVYRASGEVSEDTTTTTTKKVTTTTKSQEPSQEPSKEPSQEPSQEPSKEPSQEPSKEPSKEPSEEPSEEPSQVSTDEPSEPSEQTSVDPTDPTDPPEATTTYLIVEGRKRGDDNKDGVVDMKDVLNLRKWLAGMPISVFSEYNADANGDGAIDLKDVLTIRRYLAHLGDLAPDDEPTTAPSEPTEPAEPTEPTEPTVIPDVTTVTEEPTIPSTSTTDAPTTTTTTVEEKNIRDRAPYVYNSEGQPIINFRKKTDNTILGTWWWWTDQGENAKTRKKYMDFLEENGCTEIYYYGWYYCGTTSGQKTLHEFVADANAHGMTVSLIYDDPDMRGNDLVNSIVPNYVKYALAYPDDNINGIHLDVEHQSVSSFATIVDKFKPAQEKGLELSDGKVYCPISMDVNCEMSTAQVTAGDVTGNIYEVICANADNITLMSYRDTYEDIWALGKTAYQAAMKYNCSITFGVETGAYDFNDPNVEFAQENKEYMYEEFAQVYFNLADNHPEKGYGIAVHQHEDWYNLATEAENPMKK